MSADLVTWLLTPISGRMDHELPAWTAWHGRAMVAAWAILLPLGVLVARYFKVMPRQAWPDELDNKTWWHWHRILQTAGVLSMTLGCSLALGRAHDTSALAQCHRWFGWAVMASGWVQVLGGVWRGSKGGGTTAIGLGASSEDAMRGDHYDMTARRYRFEYVHKVVGTAAILLAVVVIGMGLKLADAPRWMVAVLTVWWLALISVAGHLQRTGRCIDTYQAIWGPDPIHPGNRMRVIGWGVRRHSRESWKRRVGGTEYVQSIEDKQDRRQS